MFAIDDINTKFYKHGYKGSETLVFTTFGTFDVFFDPLNYYFILIGII